MRTGEPAPDFELPDLDGRLHSLGRHRGRIVVLNFWSCTCPHAVRTDDLIAAWRERWGEAVVLLPIAANANESLEEISAAAHARGLPLVLLDRGHAVADLYAAQTTPEVFAVDPEGRLRYRGAVDDTSFARSIPGRFFLDEAVQALLLGESPRTRETRSYGCAIVRHALE